MLKTLTLVRHGESQWNADRRIQGQTESDLSPLGRRQAAALRGVLAGVPFDAVFASDLSRASQTAQVATGLRPEEICHTPDLREISFGDWEGLSPDEVNERFPLQWAAFREDPVLGRPPSGETTASLAARVDRMLALWHREFDGGSVLVFTHGGVVRMALIRALGLPLSCWRTLRVSNTGVTQLEFSSPDSFLRWYNLSSHLATVAGGEKEEAPVDGE